MQRQEYEKTKRTLHRSAALDRQVELVVPCCHSCVSGAFCDQYRCESETVASANLGRSQDICKGARFPVEGERCVLSS